MTSQDALETYLDFLETSSSSKENHSTPHIDAVLHHYRQRNTRKTTGVELGREGVGALTERNGQLYESRLIQLEEQLTDLLTRSKVQQVDHRRPRCMSGTSNSTKDMGSDTEQSSLSPPKSKTETNNSARHAKQSSSLRRSYRTPKRRIVERERAVKITSTREDRRKKSELLKHSAEREQQERPSVQVLTLELDGERERRWKAEQAASRLVEHVRKLQSRVEVVEKKHELAVVRGSQLEGELDRERETNQVLQRQVEQLQDNASNDQQEKLELNRRDEQQIKLLHELEENYHRLETERIQERSLLHSRVRDSETKAAGHERELDILRGTLKQGKSEIQQLQELLAKREGEHQREKERCRPLDNKEIQDLIAKQVQEERSKIEANSNHLKLKLSEQEKAYHALEKEFRMGLRIEASRYNELEKAYQEVCGGVEATRKMAVAAVQKEQRAVAMVEELTVIVKEQKVKIKELSCSKQELVAELKERLLGLEAEVADKNKIEARMLSLQEEKAKLEPQVAAQQSVIDGLREERKLWGKELAHQGASLAQERGRMEAQLDFLTQETGTLRQQLQKERDMVRVKEKQVEDQVHTIQHLKKTMAELQTGSLRLEKELQELKVKLEQEEASNVDLQDQVSALLQRKENLKGELASKLEEKKQWKAKFNELNTQWQEKVKIIDTLEENLQQVQTSFTEKEKQLSLEKGQALQSARESEQRLKMCDDAFREQLEAKERVYHSNLGRLAAEKDKEIDLANQKVVNVEEEMRDLLQEVAKEKKNMEAKFTQLTTVVQDLQKDFSDQQTS